MLELAHENSICAVRGGAEIRNPIASMLLHNAAVKFDGHVRLLSRDGARSMSFSKRFGTYRRACAVDHKVEGHRRSKVNFHSWRRWAITKVDQAGMRREDVERTFGHKVGGMSFGLYSAGSTLD